ncbi:MAG: hypothetical protein HY363_01875 [Candidatus Aenigmarchaeota archaeon]|nr:hypothetical protein [Candidatus Aenigmarchaeota archaeon]
MLAYTIKQFIYSLTVLVILVAVLFWLYKQPEIKEKADAIYANFQKYMEKYAVKPPSPPQFPEIKKEVQKEEIIVQKKEEEKLLPEIIVKQTSQAQTSSLKFDAEKKLIAVHKGTETIKFEYENASLKKISAVKPIEFTYSEKNLLTNITTPRWTVNLHYDRYDRLNVYATRDDQIRFDWDINDQLTGFKTDQGIPTTFTYYENKKIKSFKKTVETIVRYDDKNRIKGLQSDDDFMIINYWKDNLLSSLSGSKYGLKETVNYGPTEIKLVSNTEQVVFSEGTEETRIAAFNLFLVCKKIKYIPVVFDPRSWSIYSDYFKKGIVDYLVNNFVCNAVYETEFD